MAGSIVAPCPQQHLQLTAAGRAAAVRPSSWEPNSVVAFYMSLHQMGLFSHRGYCLLAIKIIQK